MKNKRDRLYTKDYEDLKPMLDFNFKNPNDFKQILFLDFDGVVNNCEHFLVNLRGTPKENKIKCLYDKYRYRTEKGSIVDIDNLIWLNRLLFICNHEDIGVVISSTWGLSSPSDILTYMNDMFPKLIVDRVLVGVATSDMEIERGLNINRYLKNYNVSKPFIIIDDDNDMTEEQQDNLILVDGSLGFTVLDLEKVENLINSRRYNEEV